MKPPINIAIFVIDDEPDMANAIGEILKFNGIHNYHLFTDPDELLTALHDDVHICIVDYYLKNDLNGMDVIKKVVERNPHCYFVMISGQESKEVVIEFTNTTWGGRYIEKAKGDLTKILAKVVTEIINHIHCVDNIYSNIDRFKNLITSTKNQRKENESR
jgi:DNA-binding NtrC family response regulator